VAGRPVAVLRPRQVLSFSYNAAPRAVLNRNEMKRDTELVATPFGSFHAFRGDMVTRQLKTFGAHQRNELAMVMSVVEPGDHVIDIGGHIGTFSIPIARRVTDAGRVFTFEPVDEHIQLLERNIKENDVMGSVRVFRSIVTDVPGRYAIHTSHRNTSLSTFRLQTADQDGDIPCMNLDEWWRQQRDSGKLAARVRLIKIDVEGMELNVLRSGRRVLESDRPILYFEVALAHMNASGNRLDEMNDLMKQFGYDFFLNLGQRNSATDAFELGRFSSLSKGGRFFDVLAIHPDDAHYPTRFLDCRQTERRLARRRLKEAVNLRRIRKSITSRLRLSRRRD